jgi:hypothetical protein
MGRSLRVERVVHPLLPPAADAVVDRLRPRVGDQRARELQQRLVVGETSEKPA